MLISEIFNTMPSGPVRARRPIKLVELYAVPDSAKGIVQSEPPNAAAPKMKLREFLVLKELAGHLKKALGQ